jgi:hypothetical protein
MCSAASSMSITRLQRDELGFPRPTRLAEEWGKDLLPRYQQLVQASEFAYTPARLS